MTTETKMANLFVQNAFDRCHWETNRTYGSYNGEYLNINLSDIVDTLIEAVGRYCDKNRNDFLITWASVQSLLEKMTTGHDYIAFAIRRLGVDSNLFLYSRASERRNQHGWFNNYYRKIFILHIDRRLETGLNILDDEMVITVTLKDVTDTITAHDLKYIESAISKPESDIKSTILSAKTPYTCLKNDMLQQAYEAFVKDEPFLVDTAATIRHMNHYLTQHTIAPDIHSVKSFIQKMTENHNDEKELVNADADTIKEYCDDQIGLIAAILRIKHEED